MPSGTQIGEQNILRFNSWVASKTPEDFRQMTFRGVLSRTEIARECGFSKSVLTQNLAVKGDLLGLEERLRKEGVLPAVAPLGGVEVVRTSDKKIRAGAQRLKSIELAYAAVIAENHELKKQLKKYTSIADALASTGRVPR
jgi:hypothetical protein